MSKLPSDIPHASDFKNMEVVKHIGNPESHLLWLQETAAAQDGRLKQTACPHPLSHMQQYEDEEPGREGRPTNLYECGLCHRKLRLIDAFGVAALDG